MTDIPRPPHRAVRFSPGRIYATPESLAAMERAGVGPGVYLARHLAGDWGALDSHDARVNDWALEHGERLLSAYVMPDGGRVWVITEWDRSSTTILLPDQY